ncbi:MAG: hypothetical protein ACI9TH_000453 [Kiritimatiellia bacterium]
MSKGPGAFNNIVVIYIDSTPGGVTSTVPLNDTGGAHEERGFTLANIGLTPGDSFNYVVTYLNPGNVFRSNELMGDTVAPIPATTALRPPEPGEPPP